MPVIALADKIHIEAEAAHAELLRLRERQAPSGRVSRVVYVQRLARAVARNHPLDLERDHVGDYGRALQPVQIELDRLECDTTKIADQVVADEARRSAGLAADDRGKSPALGSIGPFIDHPGENPVTVGH